MKNKFYAKVIAILMVVGFVFSTTAYAATDDLPNEQTAVNAGAEARDTTINVSSWNVGFFASSTSNTSNLTVRIPATSTLTLAINGTSPTASGQYQVRLRNNSTGTYTPWLDGLYSPSTLSSTFMFTNVSAGNYSLYAKAKNTSGSEYISLQMAWCTVK